MLIGLRVWGRFLALDGIVACPSQLGRASLLALRLFFSAFEVSFAAKPLSDILEANEPTHNAGRLMVATARR